MNVSVDPDSCIGCGLCVSLVPEIFALQEDGKAHSCGAAPDALTAAAIQSADACPVGAIKVQY